LWRSASDAQGAASTAPTAWATALPFWTEPAEAIGPALLADLRSHPLDVRSARSVLRTVAPGSEEPLRHAQAALGEPAMHGLGPGDADRAVVDLRVARGLLPQSSRAASRALGAVEPEELAKDLARRRFRRVDTNGALADLARIAARSGDTRLLGGALTALLERKAPGLVTLRAEVADARRPSEPPPAFRVVSGKATPYRPRDLDWRVLGSVLDAGGTR